MKMHLCIYHLQNKEKKKKKNEKYIMASRSNIQKNQNTLPHWAVTYTLKTTVKTQDKKFMKINKSIQRRV